MSRSARSNMPKLTNADKERIRIRERERRNSERNETNKYLIRSGIEVQDLFSPSDERGSPDLYEAISIKSHYSSVVGDELTEDQYNGILELFAYNLQNYPDKYKEFKADLDKTLLRRNGLNMELSKIYHYEKGSRLLIIIVFAHILPNLLKTTIPPHIASIVIYFLNLYNAQLMMYYYRVFLDSSNPGIKRLQEGEQFKANIAIEISTNALEISKNSTFFSNIDENTGKFNPCMALINIKKNLYLSMNKYTFFMKDKINRLRFVFLYFSLFIIILYIAIHYEYELKDMFNLINTQMMPTTPTTPSRQHQRSKLPRITQLNGGKRVKKPKKTLKKKP